jgi:CRISPR-associated protein Csb2
MHPVSDERRDLIAFALPVGAKIAVADGPALLNAVRRALMAMSRSSDGSVPRLFSGHEQDGAPARSGRHEHVFLTAADLDGDGSIDRVIIAAPWACDRSLRPHPADARLFARVASSVDVVRAGRLGVFRLQIDDGTSNERALIGPARCWESNVEYRSTHRPRSPAKAGEYLLRDVAAECARRGLPAPEAEILESAIGRRGYVFGRLRLRFARRGRRTAHARWGQSPGRRIVPGSS